MKRNAEEQTVWEQGWCWGFALGFVIGVTVIPLLMIWSRTQ
jgi:hypothetical protein